MQTSVAMTDIGRVRVVNQDYVYASDLPVGNLPNLYIVADGMGGHRAGDLASSYAVQTIVEAVQRSTESRPALILQKAVRYANYRLYEKSGEREEYNGMGTTLVVLTVCGEEALAVNVGDSRLYEIAEGSIVQISEDHSLVAELVRKGELTGAEANAAFAKISNQFIGILAGLIGSACYNKFKGTRLPDALSFFSGKRCVAIVTAVVSIIVAAILFFVWPIVYTALVFVGEKIVGLGVVGVGIYSFLNRLLIPFGLHHALNSVFWFDAAGINDLGSYWGGELLNGAGGSAGMYMAGFFPCMMFGLPAAAMAIIHCAKPEKKKAAASLMGAAAICAFICGVTEPFEFAFMFLAPALYLV